MRERIPELIRPILHHYLSLVGEQIPGLVSAFYLEGSIALGGFNALFSDIDFVALLDRQPTPKEFDRLSAIHSAIEGRYPRWQLSGSYVLQERLNAWETGAGCIPTYHDGTLRSDGHFELQSVEGWILKNQGIALMGPDPRDLPYEVDWALLMAKMKENLNSYWAGWARRPDRFVRMLSDRGIQWTVLGVLRQFYSFREHSITTKAGAGNYALTRVPSRWQRLIQEALHIHEGKSSPVYRFRVMRAIEARRFLTFIIEACNISDACSPESGSGLSIPG